MYVYIVHQPVDTHGLNEHVNRAGTLPTIGSVQKQAKQ